MKSLRLLTFSALSMSFAQNDDDDNSDESNEDHNSNDDVHENVVISDCLQ